MKSILLLTAMALTVTAVAQSQRIRHLPDEPLEERDMPPAPKMLHFTSPRMVAIQGGFTSVQVNVDGNGNNILGDAANEPSMTMVPGDRTKMAVGWRQFNSISSNFRQGGNGYTVDGGLHWTVNPLLENNVFRSDPVLVSTAEGVFHYNSLLETFFTTEFRSNDFGDSWTKLGPATGGDKQWLTIDNTNSTGKGFVYQAWSTAGNNYGGRQFSRSTDGGVNWMNPINIPNQPIWGTLDVATNGDLYLCGVDQGTPTFWFLRSQNAKNGGTTPTFNLTKNVNLGGDIIFGSVVNPGGLSGQCWIAVDRSGGATEGTIYMLCSVVRNGSNPCDVMLIRSTDGGNTWSTAKRINDDPQNQNRHHWFGTLSVAPNGRVDVCWLDTRNDPTNATSQLYYTYSNDGGTTFAPNIQISPAFNSTIGWPQQNKIGDYLAMTSDLGGANIVYPATFNGEQDIYFVRVPNGPQEVQPNGFNYVRGTKLSGQLSDLFTVDSNYLVGRTFVTANASEAPVQLAVTATAPIFAPSDMTVKVVAKANSGNVQQEITLFNFQTQAYESLDTRNLASGDVTAVVGTSGDRSRFIEPATGTMRVKLNYRGVGPLPSALTVYDNQVLWTLTP